MESLEYVNLRLTVAELDRTRERVGSGSLIVVLTSVPLIDAVVLGVLVRHAKQLRAAGRELVLVTDDPRTVRVIDITGLGYLFRVTRSLADALAAGRAA